jgi:hypothetical protein
VPRPHIAMRKIRDVIRLTLGEGMSLRQVSASLGVPPTTLAEHVRRIRDAGLTWPLPDDLDDDALEAKLFAPPGPRPGARPVRGFRHEHWVPYRRGSRYCGYSRWAWLLACPKGAPPKLKTPPLELVNQ